MMTNKERDELIARKLNEGMSLSDVQKLLADEYDQRMTFLELRLIAADLSVDWQKHDKPKAAPAAAAPAGADIAAVCNEAVMLAIREYVLAGKSQEDEEIEKYRIGMKHFEEALKKVKPSKKEMDVYSKFAEIA